MIPKPNIVFKCLKIEGNRHMGNMIYSKPDTIQFFDKKGLIKVGDEIKIFRNEKGEELRVWVNDELIIDKYQL